MGVRDLMRARAAAAAPPGDLPTPEPIPTGPDPATLAQSQRDLGIIDPQGRFVPGVPPEEQFPREDESFDLNRVFGPRPVSPDELGSNLEAIGIAAEQTARQLPALPFRLAEGAVKFPFDVAGEIVGRGREGAEAALRAQAAREAGRALGARVEVEERPTGPSAPPGPIESGLAAVGLGPEGLRGAGRIMVEQGFEPAAMTAGMAYGAGRGALSLADRPVRAAGILARMGGRAAAGAVFPDVGVPLDRPGFGRGLERAGGGETFEPEMGFPGPPAPRPLAAAEGYDWAAELGRPTPPPRARSAAETDFARTWATGYPLQEKPLVEAPGWEPRAPVPTREGPTIYGPIPSSEALGAVDWGAELERLGSEPPGLPPATTAPTSEETVAAVPLAPDVSRETSKRAPTRPRPPGEMAPGTAVPGVAAPPMPAPEPRVPTAPAVVPPASAAPPPPRATSEVPRAEPTAPAAPAGARPVVPPAAEGGRPEPVPNDQRHGGRSHIAASEDGRVLLARPDLTKPVHTGGVPRHLVEFLGADQQQGAARAIEASKTSRRNPATGKMEEGGFILADGTGVGKTRQILAVAAHHIEQGRGVLIVTPKQVIKADFDRGTMAGSYVDDSRAMGVPIALAKEGRVPPGEIRITTYDRFKNFTVDKNTALVFDEAHALKNAGSDRSKTGRQMLDAAHSVLFATATPMDKPAHITYLARAGVLEGRTIEQAMLGLGMRRTKTRGGGSAWAVDTRITPNPKDATTEALRRLNLLMDRMTAAGRMIRREISLRGVRVDFRSVDLTPDEHETLARIEGELEASGTNSAQIRMHLRRQQEPMKAAVVADAVAADYAAGRQPIVFAHRVNRSDVGVWRRDISGEKYREVIHSSEGTIPMLKKALVERGIPEAEIAEIHGGADEEPTAEIAAFQRGQKKVVIATMESGGVGINLDDSAGGAPRTLHVVTAPFSAMDNVQALGRAWRRKTKTPLAVRYYFTDHEVDDWNREIIARKMSTLGAAVAGEFTRKADISSLPRAVTDLLTAEDWAALQREMAPGEPPAAVMEAERARAPPPTRGRALSVSAEGIPPEAAEWTVLDAETLIPSHEAGMLGPNDRYYSGGQQKVHVRRHVVDQIELNADPDRLLSNDPDANRGAPVVTPAGYVLGGNHRALGIIRFHRAGNKSAAAYKAALVARAAEFGLDPGAIEKMERPVLVRRLTREPTQAEAQGSLIPAFNKERSASLSPSERAVTIGRAMTPAAVKAVSDALPEGVSLRDALRGDGPEPRAIIGQLLDSGAITRNELAGWQDPKTGALNEEGKLVIEKALVGAVLRDARVMESAVASDLNRIEAAAPYLITLKIMGPPWDVVPSLLAATLDVRGRSAASGKTITEVAEGGLFEGPSAGATVAREFRDPKTTPTIFRRAMEFFAQEAKKATDPQPGFAGIDIRLNPEQAIVAAIRRAKEEAARVAEQKAATKAARKGTREGAELPTGTSGGGPPGEPPSGSERGAVDIAALAKAPVALAKGAAEAAGGLWDAAKLAWDESAKAAQAGEPDLAEIIRDYHPRVARERARGYATVWNIDSRWNELAPDRRVSISRQMFELRALVRRNVIAGRLAEEARRRAEANAKGWRAKEAAATDPKAKAHAAKRARAYERREQRKAAEAQARATDAARDLAQAKRDLAFHMQEEDFARVWVATRRLEREALLPHKRGAAPNLTPEPDGFYVPFRRRIDEAARFGASGRAIRPARPAAVTRPGFSRRLRVADPSAWLPDVGAQIEADLFQTMFREGEHRAVAEAFRRGAPLARGTMPARDTAIVHLPPRQVAAAVRLGLLPRGTVAHSLEVPRVFREALGRWDAEVTAPEEALGKWIGGVGNLARWSASLDPAGFGIVPQAEWRALFSGRPTRAAIELARGYVRGYANSGGPFTRLLSANAREAMRLSPREIRNLYALQKIGLDIGGLPSDVHGHWRDRWHELSDRVIWGPEGWKNVALANLYDAFTEKTLLRRVVERASNDALGRVVEGAMGNLSFDPKTLSDPKVADHLVAELEGLVGASSLKHLPAGTEKALRATVPFATWRVAGLRQITRGAGSRQVLQRLLRTAVVMEAANYVLNGHFSDKNDPENVDAIQLPWTDSRGQHYAIRLRGTPGQMIRAVGAGQLVRKAWGTQEGVEPRDVQAWFGAMIHNAPLAALGGAHWPIQMALGAGGWLGQQPVTPWAAPIGAQAKALAGRVTENVLWPAQQATLAPPGEGPWTTAARVGAETMGLPAPSIYRGAPYGSAVGTLEGVDRALRDLEEQRGAPPSDRDEWRRSVGMRPVNPMSRVRRAMPPRVREIMDALRRKERLPLLPGPR